MAKSKVLLFLLGSCLAWSREFPRLCPNAENLGEICHQLKEINPNQVLVFEDGFTMNTCALKTVSNQEIRLREVEKNLIYQMERLISNRYRRTKDKMADAFRDPELGKSIYPALSDEFEKLKNIRQTIGVYTEIPVAPFSLNDEVKFAADSVRALATNKVTDKSSSELNHLLGIIDMARKSDVKITNTKFNCRPEVNAFYSFDNKQITMLGMAYFPPPSRIAIFGHEVGHSIETCHFTKYREKKPEIFADLESCIRSELKFVSKVDQELQCDRHTAEAFCDHIGVHVLEDYLNKKPLKVVDPNTVNVPNKVIMPPGYQNIMVFLDLACSDRATDTHPAGDKRLLDAFMRSPVIAKSLNCPVDPGQSRCTAVQGLVNGIRQEKPAAQSEKPVESSTQR